MFYYFLKYKYPALYEQCNVWRKYASEERVKKGQFEYFYFYDPTRDKGEKIMDDGAFEESEQFECCIYEDPECVPQRHRKGKKEKPCSAIDGKSNWSEDRFGREEEEEEKPSEKEPTTQKSDSHPRKKAKKRGHR